MAREWQGSGKGMGRGRDYEFIFFGSIFLPNEEKGGR